MHITKQLDQGINKVCDVENRHYIIKGKCLCLGVVNFPIILNIFASKLEPLCILLVMCKNTCVLNHKNNASAIYNSAGLQTMP